MATPEAAPPYVEPLLGVVFDLDGTLVDSHHDFPRMRRDVVRIAEKYGVTPGHLSVASPIPEILERARTELEAAGTPEGTVFRFEIEVNKTVDLIELEALPRTVARAGAESLLKALSEKGYRLGLLTRSSEEFAREALARTHLGRAFPYLRTRSAPGPAKPSPEALRLLLEEMGVPPDRAVFIGDHLIDAECAVRARVRFYAVLAETSDHGSADPQRFLTMGAKAVAEDLYQLATILGVSVPKPSSAVPAA